MRDLAPAVAAQGGRRTSATRSMPIQLTLPPAIRALDGSSRTSDSAVVVLPQPDSPAIPSASPSSSREGHAVDRLDGPALEAEVRRQVLDHEERRVRVGVLRAAAASRRSAGGRDLVAPAAASSGVDRRARPPRLGAGHRVRRDGCVGSSACPASRVEDVVERAAESVNAKTTSTMQAPAGTKYHHAPRLGAPTSRRDSRIWPHDGWNGSPRPTNDSVVSVRTAPANISTAFATIRFTTFGRMWRLHDVAAAGADHPGPVDERPLLERQGLRADDPGGRGPARDPDDDDDHDQGHPDPEDLGRRRADQVADDRREDDREHEGRDHEEEVGDAHQECVGPAADEAADDPEDGADERP